jgi:hypothetical protein
VVVRLCEGRTGECDEVVDVGAAGEDVEGGAIYEG